jgi:hypothetical protein
VVTKYIFSPKRYVRFPRTRDFFYLHVQLDEKKGKRKEDEFMQNLHPQTSVPGDTSNETWPEYMVCRYGRNIGCESIAT